MRYPFRWLFWLVVASFALWGTGALARTAKTTILIVGDSLSAGYGLQRGKAWPDLLSKQLAKTHPDVLIVNASISGETAAGGARRIGKLLETHKPAIVIVELGANDGLQGQPTSAIASRLTTMIEASQKAGAKVLLVGMDMPPNYGKAYADAFHQVYVDLAARCKLTFIPSFLIDIYDRPELFQGDRIHPTEEAQPILKDRIWEALSPMLNPTVNRAPTRRSAPKAVAPKQQR